MARFGPPAGNRIEHGALGDAVQATIAWAERVQADKTRFRERDLERLERELRRRFDDWLEARLEAELARLGRNVGAEILDLVEDRVRGSFQTHEDELRFRFNRNLDRAVALARTSIAESLGAEPPEGRRGQFGLASVRRLLRRILGRQGEPSLEPAQPGPDRPVEGLTRVTTDRQGRTREFRIGLGPYVRLLVTTSQLEWRHRFWSETTFAFGDDLVRIDEHPPKVRGDVCERWRGEVISLTGRTSGFRTMREALDDGMFHPNCTHGIKPLVLELSRQSLRDRLGGP